MFSNSISVVDDQYNEMFRLTSHTLKAILVFIGVKPWHSSEITNFMLTGKSSTPISSLDDIKTTSVIIGKDEFYSKISYLLRKYNYYTESPRNTLKLFNISLGLKFHRKSICILLGGTSGGGKSTLASLLATRLGITTVLSTDHVRSLMRSFHDEKSCPILYKSSYSAYKNVKAASSDTKAIEQSVIEGYETQNEFLLETLKDTIKTLHSRNESIIIEGVHLSVKCMLELLNCFNGSDQTIIPFVVHISNPSKHVERFAIRAKYMTLEPVKNKYVDHFNNIRIIQDHLCNLADENDIPKIDNTNVDRSLAYLHETLLEYLYQLEYVNRKNRTVKENLNLLQSCFVQALNKFGWKSKDMVKKIQMKLKEEPEKTDLEELLSNLNVDLEVLGSLES